jgi:hypothetical protein
MSPDQYAPARGASLQILCKVFASGQRARAKLTLVHPSRRAGIRRKAEEQQTIAQ